MSVGIDVARNIMSCKRVAIIVLVQWFYCYVDEFVAELIMCYHRCLSISVGKKTKQNKKKIGLYVLCYCRCVKKCINEC